jgi:hypothetical protein
LYRKAISRQALPHLVLTQAEEYIPSLRERISNYASHAMMCRVQTRFV